MFRRSLALALVGLLLRPGLTWASSIDAVSADFSERVPTLSFSHAKSVDSLSLDGNDSKDEEASPVALILPLQLNSEISESDREALTGQLVVGLQRGSFKVVTPAQLHQGDSEASTCRESGCFQKLAKSTGATHVVRSEIVLHDRDYELRISLIDGSSGETIAESDGGCEICGIVEAGNLVASAAATLRTKLDALQATSSRFVLSTVPEGAEVWIDNKRIGTTPLDVAVGPGRHALRVKKNGYAPVERMLTFVRGVHEKSEINLEREIFNDLPSPAWGWGAIGVGVAGLTTGIVFTQLHYKTYNLDCSQANGTKDSDGDCRYLWDSRWAGLVSASAGAALIGLGSMLLVHRAMLKETRKSRRFRRRAGKKKSNRDIQWSLGVGSLLMRGRF